MHAPALLTPLVLVAVLGLSAVAKLRSPQPARDAFGSLRLPGWLAKSVAPDLLPWGELLLALALLILPGAGGVAASMATTALMLVYLLLILRALSFEEPVTCGCFGELGLGEVAWRTAVRNMLLVVCGALALAAAVGDARSPIGRWLDAREPDWGWLGLTILVGALVWLVVGKPGTSERLAPAAEPVEDSEGTQELDYLRVPTPFATLKTFEGAEVTLRQLGRQQAQLILLVNSTCGSCVRVIRQIPAWAQDLGPAVAVRAHFTVRDAEALGSLDEDVATVLPDALFDPEGTLPRLLEVWGTPAAVLLGTDDMLAGGPVAGSEAVMQLVEDIQSNLADARAEVESTRA